MADIELLDDPYKTAEQPIVEGDAPISVGPGEYEDPEAEKKETTSWSDEMEIVQMVVSRQKTSSDHFRSKRDIWDKCWDHYLQIYDGSGKESWQSRVFWPETPKVCETILANLHGALLSPKTPMEWQCKIKEYEDPVKDINDLIQNDANQGQLKLSLTNILREMVVIGTGIGKVEYDYDQSITMVKTRNKMTPVQRAVSIALNTPIDQYEYNFEPRPFITRDWAKISYVDRYKIFPEPWTTEISKNHWIIEEFQISNAQLVDLSNHPDEFYRLDGITDEVLNSNNGVDKGRDPDLQSKQDALNQDPVPMNYYDPDKTHTVSEYWGPAPAWMVKPEIKDDPIHKYDSVNAWFWVVDGKYLVRAKPNPFRDGEPPYVKFPYMSVPGDWDGIGPAELILHLQVEKNELVNTALDNVNIMLNKITAILKDKVPKDCWDRLVSKPGAMWLFENTDDVRRVMMPIEFNNLLKDIYMAINMVDAAIQEVTGAVKATIGVGGAEDEAGGGTFRGQLMNKQVATEKFMLYARTLEASAICEMWRKIYQRIYQYKSYRSVEKILGPARFSKFEYIPPEELDAVADLVPLGVMTMETKSVKVAQMDAFAKSWQGRPWLKEWDLARRQWIEMGQSDPDTVIFTKEELDAFTQAKKMAAMGGGMPGAGLATGPGLPPGMHRMPDGSMMRNDRMPGMAGGPPMENNPAVNPEIASRMPVRGPGVGDMGQSGGPLG